MHVLGYFLPPDSPPLEDFLERLPRRPRPARPRDGDPPARARRATLDFDDVLRQEPGGGAVGRPHVARAIVRQGRVAGRRRGVRPLHRAGAGRPSSRRCCPTFARGGRSRARGAAASSRWRTSRIGAPGRSSSGSRERGSTRSRPVTRVTTRTPAPDSPTSRSRSGCSAPAAATGTAILSRGESHGALGSQDVPLEWLERLDRHRLCEVVHELASAWTSAARWCW